jgi:hypothetical protein
MVLLSVLACEQEHDGLSRFYVWRGEYVFVVAVTEQASDSRKTAHRKGLPGFRLPDNSDGSGGQALAPAGSATGEYGASALGGHAGTEAVGSLALQDAWLKRSLHFFTRFSK